MRYHTAMLWQGAVVSSKRRGSQFDCLILAKVWEADRELAMNALLA
jgi:hypothetical protein